MVNTCGPLSLILLYYNVNNLHMLFFTSADKDIDPCCLTYYIKELDFLIIIPCIGIDHPCEEVSGHQFLEVIHAFHDADGHHTVEGAPQVKGVLIDAILNTNGVEDITLAGLDDAIGVNHLDEKTDHRSFLGLVELNLSHGYRLLIFLLKWRGRGCNDAIVLRGIVLDDFLGARFPLTGAKDALSILGVDDLTLLQQVGKGVMA